MRNAHDPDRVFCMVRQNHPYSPDELREQAATFHQMAIYVFNRDLARRLEEQAAQLLAQAELRSCCG